MDMDMDKTVEINGQELNMRQKTTLHVALESFSMGLRHNGLGDDEHGRAMVDGYLLGIKELQNILSLGKI
jgi:hypothetical protein